MKDTRNPIVLEFTKDVTRPVVVDSKPVMDGKGNIVAKNDVMDLDFEQGDQIVAYILEHNSLYIDIEVIESPRGNLGFGFMFNVPRDVLRPERKANYDKGEEYDG
jgi:hypothetical protein